MNGLWSRLKNLSLGMETSTTSTTGEDERLSERSVSLSAPESIWLGSGETMSDIYANVRLESHLKWLNEYLLEENFGEPTESYVRKLLRNTKLPEEEESLCRRVTDLCWKLNFAVLYAHIGDSDSALKYIKIAKDELEFHVDTEMKPSVSHINAYKYAVQACTVAVLWHFVEKHELVKINALDFESQVEKLNKLWEQLNEDNSSLAVITFFKACLISSIRLPDKHVLEKLKQTVALEPDFDGWYRYLYRKLRQTRQRSVTMNMIPTEEEKDACQKAYDLGPDLDDNIANMANMLEEVLNSSKKTKNKDQIKEQLNSMVSLLKSRGIQSDDSRTVNNENINDVVNLADKDFLLINSPADDSVQEVDCKVAHVYTPRGRGRGQITRSRRILDTCKGQMYKE